MATIGMRFVTVSSLTHQVASHLGYLESVLPNLPLSRPSHCWHLYPALTAPVSVQCKKNLNSLRRIHPTIVPIIDSFSHVCLYRFHEGKRQKDSFGGTFFLFEWCILKSYYPNLSVSAHNSHLSQRAPYPPYSLFVQSCRDTRLHSSHPY